MLKNTSIKYGSMTKLLHWLIGIVVIALVCVGFVMEQMEPSDIKWQLYGMHKAIGVSVFAFIIFRVYWRLINKTVSKPFNMPRWQSLASKLTHFFLYILMIAMPLSGMLMSLFGGHNINMFGLFVIESFEKNPPLGKFFHTMHGYAAYGIAGFIIIHILAALYHHFICRDGVLRRMLRG